MLDLTTILSAVRPKDRTDQYKVLAALYCLGAHNSAVTARQVTDILKLHCGKAGTPRNVNDRLRKYSGLVSPADKGPPIRWMLSTSGLEQLRSTAGLVLAVPRNADEYDTDVAFVCALEHPELTALFRALGGASKWTEAGDARFPHVYHRSSVALPSGRSLSVVATAATSMGLTAAAIVTTQLVLQFRPRMVIMVGIAAGTKDGKKQFGDILVADPSVDYNSGKVSQEDGIRAFLPDPYPIGLYPRLRSLLHKYRGDHPALVEVKKRWQGKAPPQTIKVHVGPLGAADQVIDDESRILEIQRNWRKLIGVEMETYGVYRACWEAPEPKPQFVSFKSVCDFAAQKTDSWQEYAAFTSAEFAVMFLKSTWESLWPSE